MKLTKQMKAELAKAYQCAMEISILDMKAPLRYINQYIAENVSGYGTAADEKVKSREDYRKMVIASRQQSKGMPFKAKLTTPYRPKFIDETTAQFRDEAVVQVGDKKNKHTLHLWFSTLFKYQHSQWKMVMFHGSMPDAGSSIEDTFHVSEAEKKMKELEQEVANRTQDLVEKNRELEIEAALERVRAVAMGMKKPADMLDVCKIISGEMEKMKVKNIRNVQTAIINDEKDTYINYEYFTQYKTTSVVEVVIKLHPKVQEFVNTIKKSADAFFNTSFKGAALKKWIEYRKQTGQNADPLLEKAKSVHYYFCSIGAGALGITSYVPLTDEEVKLFHRFYTVFNLAYQRFIDIKKAAAQTREAQIQLALERVRARTMAMQHSEELSETVAVMFEQFKALGEQPERMAIEIVNEKENVFEIWATQHGGSQLNLLLKASLDEPHVMQKMYKAWKAKTKSITIDLQGKELEEYFLFLKKGGLPVQRKIFGKRRVQNVATFSKGILTIITPEPRPLETIQLLERFADVFNGTYTRFLDLQKAEAQAREAQIEAALEKVRSRSLGMHNSNELGDVISVVLEKLQDLGFVMDNGAAAHIHIYTEGTKDIVQWSAAPHQSAPIRSFVPYTDNLLLTDYFEAKEKGLSFFSKAYSFEEKNTWFKYAFEHSDFKYLPDELKKALLESKGYAHWIAIGKNSDIVINSISGAVLSEGQIEILKRFAKVFEQSYTRFLDLQKAEAQAREAKIEAALEKVRSRAMAMQKPGELVEVAEVLRKEMGLLGVEELETSSIYIHNETTQQTECWFAIQKGNKLVSDHMNIDLHDTWVGKQMLNFYSSGKKQTSIVMQGDARKEWINYCAEHSKMLTGFYGDVIPDRTYHLYKFSNGYIGAASPGDISKESWDLLKRATNVFSLAYTRFNDLQLAEAQAREAKIETALERVRSRSMGMQKSEELKEVIKIVYQQLIQLKINLDHAGFVVDYKPKGDWTFWIADEQDIPSKITHPYFESVWASQFNEAKEKGADFFATDLNFEEKNKFYNELLSYVPGLSEVSKDFYLNCPGLAASTVLFDYISLYIENFKGIPYTDEENKILMRFGKIFQQTYTRFLDLQKAEAQTREAEIELGLERVRARAMAMNHSSELSDLVNTVFNELTKLDFALNWCIINIIDEPSLTNMVWAANPETNKPPESYLMKFENYPFHHSMMKGYQERKTKHVYVLEGKEKKTYDEYLFNKTEWKRVPKEAQAASRAMKRYVATFTFSNFGGLQTVGEEYLSEENLDILSRFGKVFDLTYTRFNDLQKAEAQAREAQIEAALERVRGRSMAMYKSDELLEAGEIIFVEMQKLGIESLTAGYVLMDKEEKNGLNYTPNPSTKKIMPLPIVIPHNETTHMQQVVESWRKGNPFFIAEMDEDETIKHQTFIAERSTNFPLTAAQLIAISPARLFLHNFYFREGYILIVGGTKLSAEQTDIMLRFAKVFQQTYTRFLDLQKAEAQAREAQIEAALERTRTQSMIMQHSNELDDTLRVFHQQVQLLGIHSAFSFLWLPDEAKDKHIFWAIWEENKNGSIVFKNKAINYPLDRNEPATKQCLIDWKGDEPVVSYAVLPEGVENYFAAWQELIDGVETLRAEHFRGGLYYVEAFMKYGCFGVILENDLTKDEKKILGRIAIEFERTYTRFLDLQKAEAQAREAQIEASLERVRSRSMSMHSSIELLEVIKVIAEQLRVLNFKFDNVSFGTNRLDENFTFWLSAAGQDEPLLIEVPYLDNPAPNRVREAEKNKVKFFADVQTHEENKQWTQHLIDHSGVKFYADKVKQYILNAVGYARSTFILNSINLYIGNYHALPYTETENQVFNRFALAFEQSYTRFLDLQKAEAQAREAMIETALEKVRSRTMAMQKSDELSETAAVLFQEFKKLGSDTLYQVTIGIYHEPEQLIEFRVTSWLGSGEQISKPFMLSMEEPTLLKPAVTAWKAKEKLLVVNLTGEALDGWINYRNKMSGTIVSSADTEGRRVISIAFFSKGHLSLSSPVPLPADTLKTLERFAAVFDGTYTRFNDLQKAEAQAREAQIEAGLERVRSRTLAMQKSDELAETAVVLFQQLILLGIAPNRLYITIINEETDEADFWITDEDGSKLTAAYTASLNANSTFKKMYEGWKQQSQHQIIDMQGGELQNYFHYLQSINVPFKGGLEQKRRVQHLAYFSRGFIGMAAPDEQPAETLQVLERFAAVFNLTFTRFNDLKIAEAHAIQAEQDLIAIKEAKQKAEEALIELQATQKQLVQSEKMASLGELTAGIAHEIQNPLNFVNNFSEVSKELLDEMKMELDKGNTEDAKEIMNDVIQNLEKINHHGKRADGIVKGMLQHSRSSSGVKEPTDINALCDEYLRLSYHGLRAKDKSFNATIKTDFDNSIGSISILPQDIGRVVLNLLTNAFYVVDEKKKQQPKEYEPTVSISTKKIDNKVEIKVIDNGNGIPQKVLDKIFQPFFTTKPTGQGTGLGLSLSYDIVTKGHGGEIKVNTKENDGTEFTIILPA